ncbi:50S ribosomal protein L19 [bacterium]|nr:50S ribosomal protein L19 [bacterium]
MHELLKYVQAKHMKRSTPDCRVGDTVRVMVRVKEGTGKEERVRLQAFEGVVIGRSGGGIDEALRVRRVTHGIGVERLFPLHSPIVADVLTVRHGKVRRSKLYYLRDRVGKKARVKEQERDVVVAREKASKERREAEAAAIAAEAAAAQEQAPAE